MPKRICNEEELDYLRTICPGRFIEEITAMFNERFGRHLTLKQMHQVKARSHIRSNVKGAYNPVGRAKLRRYTDEEEDWLAAHQKGCPIKQLLHDFNAKFNRELNYEQLKGIKARRHWDSGLTGRFTKGHVPANKGTKHPGGYPGEQATWFKKGHKPQNWKPVGSERIDVDGYRVVKVKEPRTWKLKHRVVWEQAYGPVPDGCAILFLDGNRLNCDINNLALVTRFQLQILNKRHLLSNSPNINKSGILIAKVLERGFKRMPFAKRKSIHWDKLLKKRKKVKNERV